jgi:hypothetical protein
MLQSEPSEDDICFDLSRGTFMMGTVITDLMLPLAVWMGFKNIYLKGCSGGAGHFYDKSPRHFWDENHQKKIYGKYYSMFKKKLNEVGVNIYNLDKPDLVDDAKEKESLHAENPTKFDGHFWDGPLYGTKHVLGEGDFIIEHKDIDEVLGGK